MFADVLHITVSDRTLIHILTLGILGFLLSTALTPLYTTVAYKLEWWKRQRTADMGGVAAPVYQKLHAAKHKRNVPTMAGLIFVVAVAIITLAANLSRSETWLPLAGLVAAGAVGLLDDFMNIRGNSKIAGMRAKTKLGLYSIITLAAGWWFYDKLGVTHVYVPGFHQIYLGAFIIALFWFVVVATANAVNMTDGLDGLAGGLLVTSFIVYAIICAIEGQYALAAFCVTIVGALMSYTWFNIYPARFFMGDIGAFALGTALGVVAMLTNTIYVLPIIGAVYVMEAGSVIINRTSRKLRHGKKVFLSSPIHHHFEAIGWPETKVTMRFWVLGQIAGVLGLILFLVGKQS